MTPPGEIALDLPASHWVASDIIDREIADVFGRVQATTKWSNYSTVCFNHLA
ncbi:hypothetical protein PISMIDRAFT_681627 [Pisolithus microcarpus 441]|uniref:Uncharacterized protein n=1 Tax=Pisolithus microcarpus 441 TaxID=765257 RepID=A0A0C9ZF57_9AGAM|nr:hypothetical protein PISMIDRAFT_681627 [Pisolithus microcarpus 441]